MDSSLDSENRYRTERLSQKVAQLKNFAVDIETESKEHNKLLDDADSDFDSVFGFLRGGQNRVTRLLGASKGNRKFLFYLSIGLASFLLFSYYLISRSLTSNDN